MIKKKNKEEEMTEHKIDNKPITLIMNSIQNRRSER